MAWLLFLDESGQDHRDSPYEVLAGVAVKDTILWEMIQKIHDAELFHFGRRYSKDSSELKGKKILKKKVFRHLSLTADIEQREIPYLARQCLDDGAASSSHRHLKALALAKTGYVASLFGICEAYRCRIFASIVDHNAPKSLLQGLRKDYTYLFERFFYFLEDDISESGIAQQGIIIFDEMEKSMCHLLIDQAQKYFKHTEKGRSRSRLIVPEPLFVHSDLTTGVQIADLIAYCLSWTFRLSAMTKPKREELERYLSHILKMRHRAIRYVDGNPDFEVWSIKYLDDLRTSSERLDDQ